MAMSAADFREYMKGKKPPDLRAKCDAEDRYFEALGEVVERFPIGNLVRAGA
mgnify:FL=1